MAQRKKLMKATMMAQAIKHVTRKLEFDARDFDYSFPLSRARQLNNIADEFLKLK